MPVSARPAFIARVNQRLLNAGLADTGIICCGTMDYENFEKIYKPFDNLTIICDLKSNGDTGYEIIGNITEAIPADYDSPAQIARLNAIAANHSLQMISFTITEKGYALRDADGSLFASAAADMEAGPSHPVTCMGFIASLLNERFKAGRYPLALVSMDNCSHNGDKLQASVTEIIDAWAEKNYGATRKPVFVCGDFNCLPESAPITAMKEAGFEIISSTGNTFTAKNPSKCIDYIFIKKHGKSVQALQSMIPTRFEKGDVTVASDHLPVFVDVKL